MKHRLGTFAALLLASTPLPGAEQFLYLSNGGNVTVYSVDAATGELTEKQEVEVGSSAGPQAFHPDGSRLYVTGARPEESGGKAVPGIATFQHDADGSLSPLAFASITDRPSYLSIDATGSYLAGSHYGAGTATTWALDLEGLFQGTVARNLELEQKAHAALFTKDNRFLLVPATGPNCVFQLQFDATNGELTPNTPLKAMSTAAEGDAQQPRHLIFHPTLPVAYTTQERELPGVAVWDWDAASGQLTFREQIVTQPEDFDGFITTADLHLTPDHRFLYVSNRDVTDRKATSGRNSIVGFKVSDSGDLEMIGHTPCEHVPRSFCVDQTGSFVYVAGQGDHKLGAYRIDQESGELTKITQYEVGTGPNWVQTRMRD